MGDPWVSGDGESQARELLLGPGFPGGDSGEGPEHTMAHPALSSGFKDSSNRQVPVPTHPLSPGACSSGSVCPPDSIPRARQTHLAGQVGGCFCSSYFMSSGFYSTFPREESRAQGVQAAHEEVGVPKTRRKVRGGSVCSRRSALPEAGGERLPDGSHLSLTEPQLRTADSLQLRSLERTSQRSNQLREPGA